MMHSFKAKVQQLLSHAHTWVQASACKLFDWLFSTYKTADVTSERSGYFSINGAQKVCNDHSTEMLHM